MIHVILIPLIVSGTLQLTMTCIAPVQTLSLCGAGIVSSHKSQSGNLVYITYRIRLLHEKMSAAVIASVVV